MTARHLPVTVWQSGQRRAATASPTFSVVTRQAVERWTPAELVRVVDNVRRRMPRAWDATVPLPGSVAEHDRFTDGRRLIRLEVATIGPRNEQAYRLWVFTAGGHAAEVRLPGMFPGAVLAALATSRDQYARLILELNNRAIADARRSRARETEQHARKRLGVPPRVGRRRAPSAPPMHP